jgi:hypothetical protein
MKEGLLKKIQELLTQSILLDNKQKNGLFIFSKKLDENKLQQLIDILTTEKYDIQKILEKVLENDKEGKIMNQFKVFKQKTLMDMVHQAEAKEQEIEDLELASIEQKI